ncbi:MAG: aminopeptidase [Anaerolineales bacterium]|nr:aminopeptidase [Anaerolineales bacterium]
MTDPRITKLAQVLVHYSVELKPGQQVQLRTHPLAQELSLAVYAEAIKAGANVFVQTVLPGADEIFFRHASDAQLDYVSPIRKLINEQFDAAIVLSAEHNTRELSNTDPAKQARLRKAGSGIQKTFFERAARKELRWVLTEFPTYASAQDAEMSLREYEEFVYGAGLLNEPDPVALWRAEGQRQMKLINWLKGKNKVTLKGANIDLSLSIQERVFIEADGKYNFPDGEIFTGPVEDSVNGWVRFRYPAIYGGQEVTDIELWFENGQVVKEKASKGQELLTSLLNMDAGARYLGEWGIGTNYGIQRFTKNMLFDEKMGGTIHLAVGASYPESGGKNESGLHWDMLCDMAESEVTIDGELFYKNGQPVV